MELIFLIIILIATTIIKIILEVNRKRQFKITEMGNISQNSYKRYAKFYDNIVPEDMEFESKINKIYNMIVINKEKDIKKIAAKTGCTYEECILKIKYLKNKRQIGAYHIDHKNGKICPCTEEELKLIEKYKPYIYYNHLSISEIASRLPGVTSRNLQETKETVYQEIYDLYTNNLINGIKINEVDREIIYYTIEKRKKEHDFITISCKNCGALNDVNRGSKVRCEYCGTIIEDTVVSDN